MHSPARLAVVLLAALAGACSLVPGLGPDEPRLATHADTVIGTGTLREVREWRDRWRAHRPARYTFERSLGCFCMPEATQPHVMEVAGDSVVRVTVKATGAAAPAERGQTIDDLFDAAIAWLERGGDPVQVRYHATLGYPMRLEIGTLANDAGIVYVVDALRRLE